MTTSRAGIHFAAAGRQGRADLFLGMALLLLSSGNPAFAPGGKVDYLLIPVAIGLLVAMLMSRSDYRNRWAIPVLLLFALINLVQMYSSLGAPARSAMAFLLRVVVAYGFCRLNGSIARSLVNAMVLVATVAVAIFFVQLVCQTFGIDLAGVVSGMAFDQGDSDRIYTPLHNFNGSLDRFRNAGIFWEPGAFAGYTSVALILLALTRDQYTWPEYRARLVVLLLAIATARSTTGFIVLPLILVLHLSAHARRRLNIGPLVMVWLFCMCGIAWIGYEIANSPAVRDKIEEQVAQTVIAKSNWQATRIGTMIADLTDVMQRPWLGWGANPLLRPSLLKASETVQQGQGNGLSNFLARFGVIGMTIYLLATAHGLYISSGRGVIAVAFATGILCVCLMGENFLNFPLFLAFMFLGVRKRDGSRVLVLEAPPGRVRPGDGMQKGHAGVGGTWQAHERQGA